MALNTNNSTDTVVPSTGTFTVTGATSVSGNATVGGTLNAANIQKGGANLIGAAAFGSGTMSSGDSFVSTAAVAANSIIIVTRRGDGSPPSSPGHWYVHSITAGSGFSVRSTSGSDSSTMHWAIFNP